MTDYPWHQSLHLENFTVFRDTTLEFVPGVNVFIGENGTGKTHLLKAMYAAQSQAARQLRTISETLGRLFQTEDLLNLIRLGTPDDVWTRLTGVYHGHEWLFDVRREGTRWVSSETALEKAERPIFIPAIDMMGHTKGYLAAANEVVLDFDLTCNDLVGLLGLKRRNGDNPPLVPEGLPELLGGTLDYDENTHRFYLVTAQGRLPMPLVAEGLRKIATLVRLGQNGWITPGTTLFWDEPEVNLNPVLMDEVVGAILALARAGVQVFLATHSYVMLREIEIQSRKSDSLRYFALSRATDNITAHSASSYLEIDPNPIERQYASLYDRGIAKRLGGKK